MIIKTRLASDSPLYRLTAIDIDTSFEAVLDQIVEQWNLAKDDNYSLVWRESLDKQDELIIDTSKEWQLFCRLHPVGKDEVVDLQLVPASALAKLVPFRIVSESKRADKKTTASLQEKHPSETTAAPAPKFAFHSVEPQPLRSRKTYAQIADEEAQRKKMQESEAPATSSTLMDDNNNQENGGEEVEQMSAYDRVMARSRMQGEGLNQFFGSIMAGRAGHRKDADAEEPPVEGTTSPPAVTKEEEVSEEATGVDDAEPSSSRPQRSKEEIAGTNSWLENAWEERLKNMGHGHGGGSPYARLKLGKGKERQEGNEPTQASSSCSRRKGNGASHLEEALEDVGPLQETNLPNTLPVSRPPSASGLSLSSTSTKTGLSRFLRKGQYSKRRPFSSQPPSLQNSGTVTPNEGEIAGPKSGRKRSISFRSLSDALLKENRSESKRPEARERYWLHIKVAAPTERAGAEPFGLYPESNNSIVNSQHAATAEEKVAEAPPTIPPKQRDREIVRPTLLRASQSTPLTSTAVNLSSAGGITLHISTLGQPFLIQSEEDVSASSSKSDLFDLMLPKEIRLKCFESLIRLHQEEEEMYPNTAIHRQGYSGKEAAARELIRLSRVSRTWQSLLLDGQLWTSVDSLLLSNISNAALLRLTRSAGPFIKNLDLQQSPHISSSLLFAMTSSSNEEKSQQDAAIRYKSMMNVPTLANTKTFRLLSLTTLNLKGCRNLTTNSLHNVLVRLPSLLHLNISNMDCVTNDTCLLLGSSCPNLESLDVSRCINMSGKGLVLFIQAAQGSLYDKALFSPTLEPLDNQESITLPLCELTASGCAEVNILLMTLIGNSLRSLQVLDLSYCSDLTDEGIGALISHPGPAETQSKVAKTTYQLASSHGTSTFGPFITLTPRQAGGDVQSDEAHHRRLLGSLRHISLSSCRKLTDRSCILLAYAVPNLQYVELANIGIGLRDEGLIALFKSTPRIQRVDLEGASEITEKVIEALTPGLAYIQSIGFEKSRRGRRSLRKNRTETSVDSTSASPSRRQRPAPPGAYLTHLVLSNVLKPDADCLLNLIRRCPRLTHLQLDDTKGNDVILKEFVTLCRQREVRGAYISLVDCRALSRNANSDILAQAGVRPREGRRGREFRHLEYGDVSLPLTPNDIQHNTTDECDDRLVVVKTFFNWETRSQQRRLQQRRNQRAMAAAAGVTNRFLNRTRRDSLGAALSFIGGNLNEEGEGAGRWNRFTGGLLGQGDEADDARACIIM